MIESLLFISLLICDINRSNPNILHCEDSLCVVTPPPHLCTSAESVQTPTSAENQTLPEFWFSQLAKRRSIATFILWQDGTVRTGKFSFYWNFHQFLEKRVKHFDILLATPIGVRIRCLSLLGSYSSVSKQYSSSFRPRDRDLKF